jgi:hypothetical protein
MVAPQARTAPRGPIVALARAHLCKPVFVFLPAEEAAGFSAFVPLLIAGTTGYLPLHLHPLVLAAVFVAGKPPKDR